jgi:hypothetical protein
MSAHAFRRRMGDRLIKAGAGKTLGAAGFRAVDL